MKFWLGTALAAPTALVLATAAIAGETASDLPLPEFMGHVMQRNAEQLWGWTSVETDGAGTRTGEPKTAEQWEQAESDALTVQQLTYTLQNATFRPDDSRWDKLIGDLRAAATASADAAEHKDFAALTRAGDEINAKCVACHWAFAPQLETPPPPVPLPKS